MRIFGLIIKSERQEAVDMKATFAAGQLNILFATVNANNNRVLKQTPKMPEVVQCAYELLWLNEEEKGEI